MRNKILSFLTGLLITTSLCFSQTANLNNVNVKGTITFTTGSELIKSSSAGNLWLNPKSISFPTYGIYITSLTSPSLAFSGGSSITGISGLKFYNSTTSGYSNDTIFGFCSRDTSEYSFDNYMLPSKKLMKDWVRWYVGIYGIVGSVGISGTPTNGELGIWTNATTQTGNSNLQFSGGNLFLGLGYGLKFSDSSTEYWRFLQSSTTQLDLNYYTLTKASFYPDSFVFNKELKNYGLVKDLSGLVIGSGIIDTLKQCYIDGDSLFFVFNNNTKFKVYASGILGSISANQIAYGSGTNSITGSASFLFTESTRTAGAFYTGTTWPVSTNRFNYDGEFYSYSLYSGTSDDNYISLTTGSQFIIRRNGTNRTVFQPEVAAGGGSIAYLLDTRYNLTTGKIVSIKNSGSELFSVSLDSTTIKNRLHLTPISTPGSPSEGDIYSDISDNHQYAYNGSEWKQLDNDCEDLDVQIYGATRYAYDTVFIPMVLTCDDQIITLRARANQESVTWLWSNNVILSDLTVDSADVFEQGIYSVIVTNINSGCKDTASVYVTLNQTTPTFTIDTLSSPGVVNLRPVTSTKTGNLYDYYWSGTGITNYINSPVISVIGTGTYTVTAVDNNNGCEANTSVVLTSNDFAVNPYAFFYRSTDTTIAVDVTTWYKIGTFTEKYLSGMTRQADSVQLTSPGIYRILWDISFDGLNNEVWEFATFKDGVLEEPPSYRYTSTSDVGHVTCTTVLESDGTNWVSFKFQNTIDGDDPTFKSYSIWIDKIK